MTATPHQPQLRAAIYARISLDRKDEQGVDRQVYLARMRAEADEAEIVDVFVDNNISAFSGVVRPEYGRLIQAITEEAIDRVYVFALDRLTRRTKDTLELFELCEAHNVKIIATQGYSIDPTDPSSRLVIVILGLIAEQESIDRAARIRASYEDRARTGRPKTGGRRMLGYEADAVTINEPEAQAIKDAASMVLAGKTLRETVREVFHARGISATSGREMTAPTLRDVLLNPRVRGLSTFTPTDPETGLRFRKDRKTIGKGNWPAIIDEETGARLDLILNDPGRKTTHAGTAPTRFLASVLTCTCGDPMYSRSRKNKDGSPRRFYTCKRSRPGERHVSIGDEIDDIIEAIILKRMAKPDAIEAIQVALTDPSKEEARDKIRQLHAERAVLLTRREDLEQSVAEGELSASAFNRIEAKIIGKIVARSYLVTPW